MPDLRGRMALVTGASRGIGLACATALAAAGARVAMIARGEVDLAKAADALGRSAMPIACDVADSAAVERALERVREEAGDPDILINNAGRFVIAPVAETPAAEFAAVVTTNLIAPFMIVRALLPLMQQRGQGHVLREQVRAAGPPRSAARRAAGHGHPHDPGCPVGG
jgi:gluconate 5-dehydrogenase